MGNNAVLYLMPSAFWHAFEIVFADLIWSISRSDTPVAIAICGYRNGSCAQNPFGIANVCAKCKSTAIAAVRSRLPKSQILCLTEPTDTIGVDTLDMRGAESTVLTYYRDDGVNKFSLPSLLVKKVKAGMAKYAAQYSYSVITASQSIGAYKVAFFNGRQAPYFSVSQRLLQTGIKTRIIEVHGLNSQSYCSESGLIHSYHFQKERIKSWHNYINSSSASYHEAINVSNWFYESRLEGKATNARTFVSKQKNNTLQKYLAKRAKREMPIISIFTSSQDEMKIAGRERETELSLAMIEAIKLIFHKLKKDYTVVVRFHPNQKGDKTGEYSRSIRDLKRVEGLITIPAVSRISTYELLATSSYVFTFGSSISLEALYSKKKVILMGKSMWDDAIGLVNICSFCELEELLNKIVQNHPLDYISEGFPLYTYASFLTMDKEFNPYLTRKDRFYADGINISYGLARQVRSVGFIFWKAIDGFLRRRCQVG